MRRTLLEFAACVRELTPTTAFQPRSRSQRLQVILETYTGQTMAMFRILRKHVPLFNRHVSLLTLKIALANAFKDLVTVTSVGWQTCEHLVTRAPTEYQSTARPCLFLSRITGANYSGVPHTVLAEALSMIPSLLKPKSVTFAWPSPSSSELSGFKSR